MNKYYIKFDQNKQITCDHICNIVQQIVKHNNQSLQDKVLVLELKDITSSADTLLPKIGFDTNSDSKPS